MGRRSNARQRLIHAARELMWSYSYGAVTVADLCERAAVKKGSFYHFFDSKADVAEAAVRAWWDETRPEIEALFRPEIAPQDRILRYFDLISRDQILSSQENGRVEGCPLFKLGSEICAQDTKLRALVREILDRLAGYFEKAIEDAQSSGVMKGDNAARTNRLLWGVYGGTLTRARIENNQELVRTLSRDAGELLCGRRTVRETTPASLFGPAS